jgi:hypothetical protein
MNDSQEVKPPLGGTANVSAPLLDEATVTRLRAKETAQLQAKAERQQKRSEAGKLADAMRREELRQIPMAKRSEDERREFSRLEARRRRAGKSKADALADVASAKTFWEANCFLLTEKKRNEYLVQQERVLDLLFWMQNGWAEPPHSPDFVSLNEGLAGVDEHVAEHGVISDDPSSYKHHTLQDFKPGWGVWAQQDIEADPIWGYVPAFYKDAERFKALCLESPATEIYARYGIRTAIPAYHLRKFKQRINEHAKGEHKGFFFEGCWLCDFQRHNEEAPSSNR